MWDSDKGWLLLKLSPKEHVCSRQILKPSWGQKCVRGTDGCTLICTARAACSCWVWQLHCGAQGRAGRRVLQPLPRAWEHLPALHHETCTSALLSKSLFTGTQKICAFLCIHIQFVCAVSLHTDTCPHCHQHQPSHIPGQGQGRGRGH